MQSGNPTQSAKGDKRRDAILQFIADYWTVNEIAPTVREIARGVGLRHPSGAHYQLILLERAGLIKSVPGSARSIRVVER